MRLIRLRTDNATGKRFPINAGRKLLIVAKDDHVWLMAPNGSEEILSVAEDNRRIGEEATEVRKPEAVGICGTASLDSLDVLCSCHDDHKPITLSFHLLQEGTMSRVEAVERAESHGG